ncbi:MAG: phage late control D family protein [Stenomitos frigidus ULC029]
MPVANPSLAPPNFAVKINGTALPDNLNTQVMSVTVDDDTDLPSMFTLGMASSVQQTSSNQLIDQTLFAIGNVVEVKLGYGDRLMRLISGEITGLEPEFTYNGLPSLTVRGYDRRHRLQRGRKTRTFVQQKDSDIAAQIAREAGLSAQIQDSQVTHPYTLQANQTDLEFLQTRSRQIRYEVVVDDRTLIFRSVANAESEVLTLTFEDDLLEFYPRLSSMGQVNEVSVRSWNPKDKKEIIGQARRGDEVSTMGGQKSGAAIAEAAFSTAVARLGDRPVRTQAEADQLAKAHFNQDVLALIKGEGVCKGHPQLRAGKVIKIDGIGQRFSGNYYVTAASHRYSTRGYDTHFTVQRNSTS